MSKELEVIQPKLKNSERLLLRHARKSLNEIEKLTGIPALEAHERINQLLDEEDWTTELQKEQLLIRDLQDLIDDVRERARSTSDEFYADMVNSAIRGMNTIGARWDARRKIIQIDLDEITARQAALYGQAFDLALWHVVEALMEENPEISRAHVRDLVRAGMRLAQDKLSDHVRD